MSTAAIEQPTVLNVLFELPNLVVKPDFGDKLWEFSFKDELDLNERQLKAKYADEDESEDLMFVILDFAPRQERNGRLVHFKSYAITVRPVGWAVSYTDSELRHVRTAVLHRVVGEVEMLMRQSIWRVADPLLHDARLVSYEGEQIARTRPSHFLPRTK